MCPRPLRPPSWLKGRDPKDIALPAQWSEDWTTYHIEGLRFILRSGRFHPDIFTPGGVQKQMPEPVLQRPWLWGDFLAARLLAGAGCELLLKGVYLKNGYSIRAPRPRKPLAKRGSDDDRLNNPFKSVSFSDAIHERNLQLINGPDFNVLRVAQEWRNGAAHAVESSVVDAGVHMVALARAIYSLHKGLLDGADENHHTDIEGVLRVTHPVFIREQL